MKLWLDDKRAMPRDYDKHVLTAAEAIAALETGEVTEVSLDHDLGPEWLTGNGYMVAKWIEEHAFHGTLQRLVWHVHSQNSVGAASMRAALVNANRFWSSRE